MLPIEVKISTIRTQNYVQDSNHTQLEETLDLIEEKREEAQLRNAAYQQRTTRYFNKRVRDRKFGVGDLILRRVFLATRDPAAGVLGPNWEGPYQIESVIRPGVYKLARSDGSPIPRAWNGEHLRPYYQ